MDKHLAIVLIVGISCVAAVILSITHAWLKAQTSVLKHRASSELAPPDVMARLDRIEQALEAVSLETERNGEAQRYLVKLLGEKGVESLPR